LRSRPLSIALSSTHIMLALVHAAACSQSSNYATFGFTARTRMTGGGEGTGYGGLLHSSGRVYYSSDPRTMYYAKRVDTLGSWQDQRDGVPAPTMHGQALNKRFDFSSWYFSIPHAVTMYHLNNTDGTCVAELVENDLAGPTISVEAYSATGASATIELDGADSESGELMPRGEAPLWAFNQSCGPMVGTIDSQVAAREYAFAPKFPMAMPLRRSTQLHLIYDNHHTADAWSVARYTDVQFSNSSSFVVDVNMDTVAYDVAAKFTLPDACANAKPKRVACAFGSGIQCTSTVGKRVAGVQPSAACLSPLFPEGALFPAPPVSEWWGATRP